MMLTYTRMISGNSDNYLATNDPDNFYSPDLSYSSKEVRTSSLYESPEFNRVGYRYKIDNRPTEQIDIQTTKQKYNIINQSSSQPGSQPGVNDTNVDTITARTSPDIVNITHISHDPNAYMKQQYYLYDNKSSIIIAKTRDLTIMYKIGASVIVVVLLLFLFHMLDKVLLSSTNTD